MTSAPRKVELVFFRNEAGGEPVRDWLKSLDASERHEIGRDLLRGQWQWPVGMPLCRPMGGGLWEIRTSLPGNRSARVLICFCQGRLVALHGFIKKMIWRWRVRRSWSDEQKAPGIEH